MHIMKYINVYSDYSYFMFMLILKAYSPAVLRKELFSEVNLTFTIIGHLYTPTITCNDLINVNDVTMKLWQRVVRSCDLC